ncbi:DUF4382 domain-containing protein [uncultured Marinobacter sp.]|uniref:DUF4382 domain-containing protein n=1 Tax=uncultured Marinobacter sp. TaxID=187379 RepID=UPI000C0ABE0E|nr:hypothetical protein [Marinobacter sp.]MBI43527.1 hypothetical protein [Oceanospirillales bacterium]
MVRPHSLRPWTDREQRLTKSGERGAAPGREQEVPAGEYTELRLLVDTDASYVAESSQPDVQQTLAVPSGEQSGLKLKGRFVVAADTRTDFTVDFDVAKSIVNPEGPSLGDYLLKPVLRLVNNLEVGSISGNVDYATLQSVRLSDTEQADCAYSGAVYVYEGADVTPTDLNVNAETDGPLLVVPVSDDNDGQYRYTAAFLPAGDYTLGYSCQLDDNETDDVLEFDGIQTVTVVAGNETIAAPIPLQP